MHDYVTPLRKFLCQPTDIDIPFDVLRAKFYFDLMMGSESIDRQRALQQLQAHVPEYSNAGEDELDPRQKSLNSIRGQ